MSSFARYDPSMGITRDQYEQKIAQANKRLYGSVMGNKTGQANLVPSTLHGFSDTIGAGGDWGDGGLSSVFGSLFGPDSSDPYDESQRIMDELRKEYSGPVTQNDIQWRGLGGQGYTPQFIEFAKSKGYEVATGNRSDAAQYLRPTNTLEPIPDRPPLAPPMPIAPPPTPIAPRRGGTDFVPKPPVMPPQPPVLVSQPGLFPPQPPVMPPQPPVMPPQPPVMPKSQPPVMPPQPPVMPRPAGVSSGDNPLGDPRYGRLPTGRDISRLVSSDDPAIRPPSILLKNMRHGGSLTHTVSDILRSL